MSVGYSHVLPRVSARIEQVSGLITQRLEAMVQAADRHLFLSKHKAISALLPYAIFLGQSGRQGIIDVLSRAISIPGKCVMWGRVRPYITMLVEEPSPPSMNAAVVTLSPHLHWEGVSQGAKAVARWAAAASAVPYTEAIGHEVVCAMLQIASIHSLRQYIPIEMWAYLMRRPTLLPICRGRVQGTGEPDIVRHIRNLGDIEILKSFFLVVWSEWYFFDPLVLEEIEISIREDFRGIGMQGHRRELIERLDHILGQLDRGVRYLREHLPFISVYWAERTKTDYRKLRRTLEELGEGRGDISACASPELIHSNLYPDPCWLKQNSILFACPLPPACP